MQLVNVSGTWRIGRATSVLKRCGRVIRAVRLHVLICPVCTPYFFANSERVSSSRIASSATLALKSGACFFLFVILDHFFHHSIHLHKWSEISRPPVTKYSCYWESSSYAEVSFKKNRLSLHVDQKFRLAIRYHPHQIFSNLAAQLEFDQI